VLILPDNVTKVQYKLIFTALSQNLLTF